MVVGTLESELKTVLCVLRSSVSTTTYDIVLCEYFVYK